MQIVIDIPESIFNTIQADEMISREQLAVLQMHILNGTPLPKGHGRLIDADKIVAEATKGMKYPANHKYMECVIAHMKLADAIIEADKESEKC